MMIWSSPKMVRNIEHKQNLSFLLSIQSVGHLLVSCVTSLYVILAVRYFEEPALVKTFGAQYRRYQQMVPKYFPLPGWSARPGTD